MAIPSDNHPFEYRRPTNDQAELMSAVSVSMRKAYDLIVAEVPASAERTLAVRKLQESRMWINVAILGSTA